MQSDFTLLGSSSSSSSSSQPSLLLAEGTVNWAGGFTGDDTWVACWYDGGVLNSDGERAGGGGGSLETAMLLLGGEGAVVVMVKLSSSAMMVSPLAVKLVMLSSTASGVCLWKQEIKTCDTFYIFKSNFLYLAVKKHPRFIK